MRALRFATLLLLLNAPAFAQSQATGGQISGRVTDSSGGVLPGATVKIANPDTGASREVTASESGLYVAPLLPTGTYVVSAALSGFQGSKVSDVVVTVGSNLTVNLTLSVGTVTETLTVTMKASAVETTSARSTTTLDSAAIASLPINGRRFQDFVMLTPTAQVDTSRGQISLSGQRGINTNISIDGADYNQPFFGGIRGGERSNFAFTIPQESIQEFQVVASGYSAEFGRSSGGVVNAVTKSGTNNLRGSAFYANRNKKLAKKNVFGQTAAFTQQLFGGSAGGPVARDRAFFFAAYEQQDFEAPRLVLFDRLTTFAPTAATQEAFNFYKSFETPFADTNDAQAWLGRFDYQFSSSSRFNIRYNGSRNEALNGNGVGGALSPTFTRALSNNGTEKDRTHTTVGQYTAVLRPTLLLEMRGQYSREVRPREANALEPLVTTAVGNFGTANFLPTTQYDWRGQSAVNLNWIRGGHSVKIGAEYNHVFADQAFGFNQFGTFNVSGTNTATVLDLLSVGGSVANRFDSRDVTYLKQIGNLLASYATDETALFAQDTWRLRPNFTLNYGLRWEAQFNPTPEANNERVLQQVRGVTFPIGKQIDPTQIPDDTDQIGPRAGFAWDPFNDTKTVVRGYTGVYHARTPSLIWASAMNNFRLPPGDVSILLPFTPPAGNPNTTVYQQFRLIGIDLNTLPLNKLPVLSTEQIQAIAEALGIAADPFAGAGVTGVDSDFQNPQSVQFGFGVEREILAGLTFGAEYNQVRTSHLQRNRDLNVPAPILRSTAVDPAQRPFFGLRSGTPRPVRGLGQIAVRESTARSLYRAFVLSSRLRRSWGQVQAFYVLSKSLSDDDNERDAGGNGFENPFNLAPEYSYARLDRRHQFNGSVLFHLPFQIDAATGFAARSGLPIDVGVGNDVNEDRGGPDRPYSAPGVPFKRNLFRNRPTYDVNLRLQKGFSLAKRQRALVTLEVFNVFRFDNIQYAGSTVTNYCSTTTTDCGLSGSPTNVNFLQLNDKNPASARVGQYLLNNTPGAPLQVQLGFRYEF